MVWSNCSIPVGCHDVTTILQILLILPESDLGRDYRKPRESAHGIPFPCFCYSKRRLLILLNTSMVISPATPQVLSRSIPPTIRSGLDASDVLERSPIFSRVRNSPRPHPNKRPTRKGIKAPREIDLSGDEFEDFTSNNMCPSLRRAM
eukprot:scaffold1469_cov119-Cylindrotheca_fusiformis.AAC.13